MSDAETELPVEIRVSEAAEALVALHNLTGDYVRCDALEVGCAWFDKIQKASSPELQDLIARHRSVEGFAVAWFGLIGMAVEGPTSIDGLLACLEDASADDVWLQVLGLYNRSAPEPEVREAMLAAGHGQLEPLKRKLPDLDSHTRAHVTGVVRALDGDAERARSTIVRTLRLWHEDVFRDEWREIEPIVERDAAVKRRLAARMSAAELVEEATNGIELVPEIGVSRLLLIPTYLDRPWATTGRQLGTSIICYPVAEDALSPSEDDARMRRLLRLSKVLADENRLRAIRLLAETSCSLQELADHLGIRKSTMHHHLAALRSAGLLRIRMNEKRYSLRRNAVSELSALLDEYVGADPEARARRAPRRR